MLMKIDSRSMLMVNFNNYFNHLGIKILTFTPNSCLRQTLIPLISEPNLNGKTLQFSQVHY